MVYEYNTVISNIIQPTKLCSILSFVTISLVLFPTLDYLPWALIDEAIAVAS